MATFPIYSTRYFTKRCARGLKVLQRVQVLKKYVRHAAVFNCRKVSGSDYWSAHSRGDAGDLMFRVRVIGDKEKVLEAFRACIKQATRRTLANRGCKIQAVQIIGWDREWRRGEGISTYKGALHNNHIHVGFSLASKVKPECVTA